MAKESGKVSFTKRRVAALPLPGKGKDRIYYHDDSTAGLTLCVTSAGTRTFYFYRKIGGRPERVLIGRFPGVTVEQARKLAIDMTANVANGGNPQADRRKARGEPTVGDLFTAWIAHAKQRKRTWAEDERQYNKYIASWSTRKLSSIRPHDVAAWHTKLGKAHGNYTANRSLALLRSAYNKAENLVGYVGANPARGATMFPEVSRERFLQAGELQQFFAAVDAEPDETFRDFVIVSLLTGARRDNVASMKWVDVDLDGRVWQIPGASAKAGKPIVIPLVERVTEILTARSAVHSRSEYVFPASTKRGYLTEPKHGWKRLLERSGIENLRIHDLRHTMASFMAIGSESLTIIGRTLGHNSHATTARYAHLSVDPVRAAITKATNAMLGLEKVEL